MQVFVQQTGQTLELTSLCTARELLAQLSINPQTVLIVVDGVLVLDDADLSSAQRVELVSVVSGG